MNIFDKLNYVNIQFNIILLILSITCILSYIAEIDSPYSITIRDNKLVVFYYILDSLYVRIRVFELKDGTLTDVYNSARTFDFVRPDSNFTLVMFDAPEDLPEVKNKLWLKFKLLNYHHNPTTSLLMNWVGYINLDDMSFKNDSSFIKFPIHENFPVKDYTVNSITNKFGSALYITGGEVYSKKDNSYTASNSFYKYNFTSKDWKDMTYSANGKLKPLFAHKSLVIDNRYLVVLGGERKRITDSSYNYSYNDRPAVEYNSLYNLTIFDTYSNSWENVNIKANTFDTSITKLDFTNFFATVYTDKIIVFGGLVGEYRSNTFTNSGYLGILDIKARNWAWILMPNKHGRVTNTDIIYGNIIAYNDQLIICSYIINGKRDIPIHVYDLISKRMKSTLRISYSSNDTGTITGRNEAQNQSKTLPDFAIVLIAVSYTVLLGVLVYIVCRKNKTKPRFKKGKTKPNGPIREVWANPDLDNTNNIITFNSSNCSNVRYSNGLYQNSDRLNISNTIEFNK